MAEDAKLELGLSRYELVALAYLLGSDYTVGVKGVGVVNAMEIVQTFNMRIEKQTTETNNNNNKNQKTSGEEDGPLNGLKQFKEWLDGFDIHDGGGLDQRKKKKKKIVECDHEDEEEEKEVGDDGSENEDSHNNKENNNDTDRSVHEHQTSIDTKEDSANTDVKILIDANEKLVKFQRYI